MEEVKGAHGSAAGETEGSKGDGLLSGVDVWAANLAALPIIEISDKDYRSFCWPCYALEETDDGKPDS